MWAAFDGSAGSLAGPLGMTGKDARHDAEVQGEENHFAVDGNAPCFVLSLWQIGIVGPLNISPRHLDICPSRSGMGPQG
jgi:hypothetical protein